MGNNQSLPPYATGFLNPNFISGNVADPSLLDDNSLVDDLTEDQFIGVIQAIINKDEVLRIIRGIALPVTKKPRKTRRSKVGRCTSETLQASIWGQLMSDIQLEIATTGVNPDSELQKTFRLRFRVPYSMLWILFRNVLRRKTHWIRGCSGGKTAAGAWRICCCQHYRDIWYRLF